MNWVLVITIMASGLRPAVTVEKVEMANKESCMRAASFYSDHVSGGRCRVMTTCISKR